MADFVIVGAGAFAREIYDWFGNPLQERGDRFIGYLEDSGDTPSTIGELPCLGEIRASGLNPQWRLVMGIASCEVKQKVANRLQNVQLFASLIHPTTIISPSARIGHGAVFAPYTIASANAQVGNLVSVNVHSSVGHDVVLGDYSTLSSYVDLTGRVNVGEGSFWGSGARAVPGVKIGAAAKIGAGSVVMRNVEAGATMFAPPARKL